MKMLPVYLQSTYCVATKMSSPFKIFSVESRQISMASQSEKFVFTGII